MEVEGEMQNEEGVDAAEMQEVEDGADEELITLDEQVNKALTRVPFITNINIEVSPTKKEKHFIAFFMGAQSMLWNGKNSSLQFSKIEVENVHSSCLALSHTEVDSVILRQIMATSNSSDATSTASKHLILLAKRNI